mmetsp:Transcript_52366/g.135718  ORF Transcript_52366/g.135718 Transcript_52366/m.135718 type:complete len:231 (+) Transcript_52366:157-849(+)
MLAAESPLWLPHRHVCHIPFHGHRLRQRRLCTSALATRRCHMAARRCGCQPGLLLVCIAHEFSHDEGRFSVRFPRHGAAPQLGRCSTAYLSLDWLPTLLHGCIWSSLRGHKRLLYPACHHAPAAAAWLHTHREWGDARDRIHTGPRSLLHGSRAFELCGPRQLRAAATGRLGSCVQWLGLLVRAGGLVLVLVCRLYPPSAPSGSERRMRRHLLPLLHACLASRSSLSPPL